METNFDVVSVFFYVFVTVVSMLFCLSLNVVQLISFFLLVFHFLSWIGISACLVSRVVLMFGQISA